MAKHKRPRKSSTTIYTSKDRRLFTELLKKLEQVKQRLKRT